MMFRHFDIYDKPEEEGVPPVQGTICVNIYLPYREVIC